MDKTTLFYRILSEKSVVKYNDVIYHIFDPTATSYIEAEQFYQEELDRCLSEGIPTEEEAMASAIERGLWKDGKDDSIKQLEEEKSILKKKLPILQFKSHEKANVVKQIEFINKAISKINTQKTNATQGSAETLAKSTKYKYLLFLLTFDTSGKRVWTNYNKFLKESNKKIRFLLSQTYFSDKIGETDIRKLARGDPWRSLWIAANKIGNLFEKPLIELTDYQRSLLSWSLIYDSAYESMECPPDDTIDNDILFDQWLEEQHDKRRSEKDKRYAGANNIIKDDGKGGETFIVVDSKEDAEKVYNSNNAAAKLIIKERERYLKKHGRSYDARLPDVQMDINAKLNELRNKR